jgi:hypothetical protein
MNDLALAMGIGVHLAKQEGLSALPWAPVVEERTRTRGRYRIAMAAGSMTVPRRLRLTAGVAPWSDGEASRATCG